MEAIVEIIPMVNYVMDFDGNYMILKQFQIIWYRLLRFLFQGYVILIVLPSMIVVIVRGFGLVHLVEEMLI
jgi:hypothetical protein